MSQNIYLHYKTLSLNTPGTWTSPISLMKADIGLPCTFDCTISAYGVDVISKAAMIEGVK